MREEKSCPLCWILNWRSDRLGSEGTRVQKIYSLLCQTVICFQIQEIFPGHVLSRCAWEGDDTPGPAMAGRATRSQRLSLNEGRAAVLQETIKTSKNAERLKFPECIVVSVRGWTPWLNISHGPERNPDRSFAAVRLDAGGRGEAGEVFLDTRGSSSFGGMEGFKERRGERSFKALWRLAAVGRAAVFPKSPPNRKTVSFFPLHKSNLYPTAESKDPLWTHRGKKNHKSFY